MLLFACMCGPADSPADSDVADVPDTGVAHVGDDTEAPMVETADSGDTGSPEPDVVDLAFTATSENFQNPERGMYTWAYLGSTDVSALYDEGYTLVYTPLELGDYRDADIPDSVLGAWSGGFDDLREAGLKAIVRATYSDASTDDAPADRVLAHIEQLSSLFEKHSDVIAVVQTGFLGAWGEWHSSSNGNLDDTETWTGILSALLAALPAERMAQLRTPLFKADAYGGPLLSADAFSGTEASRVGHHNDCFLASDTDYGTYPEHAIETWKDFVATEGKYTPVGGETCFDEPTRTTCDVATEELGRLHWSYLNALYSTEVLDRWAKEGCFDEIQRSLGYRFELTEGQMSSAVRPGGVLRLSLSIENVGYAAPYNPRELVVVMRSGDAREEAVVGTDPRWWGSGSTQTLVWQFRVPADLEEGDWEVALWLPDPEESLRDDPRYAIRLANEGVWDDGLNVIGTVVVADDAGGAVDESAEAFEAR